jgi:hypothetical protein
MLLPATAFAVPSGVTLTHEGAVTEFHGTPGIRTLPQWHPPKGAISIFNTLGAKKKSWTYGDGSGWTISNPGSEAETLQWFAYAITPTQSATLTEIAEAVGYVTGFEGVTIAVLADNNGSPGKVLWSKLVTKLETFGDCCAVATAKVKGVAVTAGTTYWIGALLPSKKEANTWDAWCFSTYNTGSGPAAYYTTSGWNTASEPYAAFAVLGK